MHSLTTKKSNGNQLIKDNRENIQGTKNFRKISKGQKRDVMFLYFTQTGKMIPPVNSDMVSFYQFE